MDSITQATLGAAAGHLCWQNQLGRKALVIGAGLGTLPDLDILLYPVLDEVQRLYWHRGESHSIWFILLGSLAIGFFLQRTFAAEKLGYREALLGVSLVLGTHVLIDLFTVYGTQLFAPVSRRGFALNNMFIIDPLFTMPLLFGTLGAYFLHRKPFAYRMNQMGLLVAILYATWSLSAQTVADRKFRSALEERDYDITRQLTSAAPMNTLLWRHIAETPDGFLLGYWSWFDDSPQEIRFEFIPQNAHIVEHLKPTRTFEAVDWFSKGWWIAYKDTDTTATVVDVRFTEIPSAPDRQYTDWQWPFAWTFYLDVQDETRLKAVRPEMQDALNTFKLLGLRILGRDEWLTPID